MIAAVLGEVGGLRTARELQQALRARGEGTGLATVYRVLHELARAGEADAVRAGRGGMLYRRCGPEHHHLLICRRCGRAVEVAGGPEVLSWVAQSAAGHGYQDVSHQIEVTGICPGCARDPAR
jgi:Fur family ferric uptake transcriptional regulator